MTAEEAYDLAQSKQKELAIQQTERFFKEIDEAANNGQTHIRIGDSTLYDEAVKALKDKGFRLDYLWDKQWCIVWYPVPVYMPYEMPKTTLWQKIKQLIRLD